MNIYKNKETDLFWHFLLHEVDDSSGSIDLEVQIALAADLETKHI